jgi:ribosomal protein S18 acetylase RimI-like enzyme
MEVREYAQSERSVLIEFLARDPTSNLFALDLLSRANPFVRVWAAHGSTSSAIQATALVIADGRLLVPSGTPEGCERLGAHLQSDLEVRRIIGPEASTIAFWDAHGRPQARLNREHRLLELTPASFRDGATSGLHLAQPADVGEVLTVAAAMHEEELGSSPMQRDPVGFEKNIKNRIRRGRTFVDRIDGVLAFKVDIGSDCEFGAQLEGVYTLPALRSRGLASRGLRTLCRALLDRRPRVTLHVHAANQAARRAYENVGFVDVETFRLISMD